jgi:hypothetical protein
MLPALPTNIRLQWNLSTITNSLAFDNTAKNIAAKSFKAQAPIQASKLPSFDKKIIG